MKKSIISMAFIAFVFAGCNTNNNNEHQHNSDGSHIDSKKVHQHEDGSTHHHQGVEHHQEEFKVETDSTILNQDTEDGHSHKDGNHQH
jgi:hypothetical protein